MVKRILTCLCIVTFLIVTLSPYQYHFSVLALLGPYFAGWLCGNVCLCTGRWPIKDTVLVCILRKLLLQKEVF